MNHKLRIGQVWESDTGLRFRISAIRPSSEGLPDLIEVRRLNSPFWDDGRYTWSAEAFASMTLVPNHRGVLQ